MTRKFLSCNEIVELVNNLSDLEVESEEELFNLHLPKTSDDTRITKMGS